MLHFRVKVFPSVELWHKILDWLASPTTPQTRPARWETWRQLIYHATQLWIGTADTSGRRTRSLSPGTTFLATKQLDMQMV